MKHKYFASRGDTIVEVIIVLAVLSLAITITYSTASRSLLAARQAQENARATQLLRSQIEALRLLAATPRIPIPPIKKDVFSQTGPFCIIKGGTGYEAVPTSDAGCINIYTFYKIDINHTNTFGKPDTFTLTASWPDVSGQGDDTMVMNYRVHKP